MCKCVFVLGFLALLGVVILILGAVLGFVVFDDLIEDHVISVTRLENGTRQFDRWQNPHPMTVRVYMFHVNNPAQVLSGAAPPNVTEVGPYVYNLRYPRGNIDNNTVNDTLTYIQNRVYEFDVNASYPLTESDTITTLNTPLQGLAQFLEMFGPVMIARLNTEWSSIFPGGIGLFHSHTVRQYLFGFTFCDMVGPRPTLCDDVLQNVDHIKTLELQPAGAVSFSFFNHKVVENGTFEIIAGMDNVSRLGEIQRWNGQTHLNAWGAAPNTCNEIRGRDSTIYPPFIEKDFTFDIFNSDICRTMNLVHSQTSTFQGITGWRYNVRSDTLDNATTSENHACFCTNVTANIQGVRTCLPTGFNDMFNCFGTSIILSFPHLLWSNPGYAATVNGLSPNVQNHVTYANIEPDTGTILESATRIQYNMIIRPIDGLEVTNNIVPSVVPILWFEEIIQLPQHKVDELDDEYFSWLIGLEAATWTLIGVGIFVIILSLILCVCTRSGN